MLLPLASRLSRRERGLLFTFALLLLIGFFGPELPAAEVAIASVFADDRAWHGMPNAMDVLSNIPFLVIGLWGLYRLNRIDRSHQQALSVFPLAPPASDPPDNTLDCAWLFFAGLIATAAGSAFFHLVPDGPRLAADRAGTPTSSRCCASAASRPSSGRSSRARPTTTCSSSPSP
jgi:hypothetical protein